MVIRGVSQKFADIIRDDLTTPLISVNLYNIPAPFLKAKTQDQTPILHYIDIQT